jgi:hypothetical protein
VNPQNAIEEEDNGHFTTCCNHGDDGQGKNRAYLYSYVKLSCVLSQLSRATGRRRNHLLDTEVNSSILLCIIEFHAHNCHNIPAPKQLWTDDASKQIGIEHEMVSDFWSRLALNRNGFWHCFSWQQMRSKDSLEGVLVFVHIMFAVNKCVVWLAELGTVTCTYIVSWLLCNAVMCVYEGNLFLIAIRSMVSLCISMTKCLACSSSKCKTIGGMSHTSR